MHVVYREGSLARESPHLPSDFFRHWTWGTQKHERARGCCLDSQTSQRLVLASYCWWITNRKHQMGPLCAPPLLQFGRSVVCGCLTSTWSNSRVLQATTKLSRYAAQNLVTLLLIACHRSLAALVYSVAYTSSNTSSHVNFMNLRSCICCMLFSNKPCWPLLVNNGCPCNNRLCHKPVPPAASNIRHFPGAHRLSEQCMTMLLVVNLEVAAIHQHHNS
jgi:hypothetical protein